MNIKLLLAYDGTHYFGWQKTSEGQSIEEELEKALLKLLQVTPYLQAASRTDRNVHAEGQVVNFIAPYSVSNLNKLSFGLNALLPNDIIVHAIEEADPHFHPTLQVKNKIYSYEICHHTIQQPRHRFFSWHFHYPLDLNKMREAAQTLIGTHDFSAFCNNKKSKSYQDYIRTVTDISICELPNHRLKILIQGPTFLYNMVRILVGTLAYIGAGKIDIHQIQEILLNKDRKLAGMTAPAHGLTLLKVEY